MYPPAWPMEVYEVLPKSFYNSETPVFYRFEKFLQFIMVVKPAVFLSFMCTWMISVGGSSSHKSKSSEFKVT